MQTMAKKQEGQCFGDILREAGITPSDFAHSEKTPGLAPKKQGRKQKRTAKSRAKMWHITGLLTENPDISDADIKRSIQDRFKKKDGSPESVADDIIKEARWIFARKLERGDIVVKGQKAHLANVQRGYLALSKDDRNRFLTWLHTGAEEDEIRKPNESARDHNERLRRR